MKRFTSFAQIKRAPLSKAIMNYLLSCNVLGFDHAKTVEFRSVLEEASILLQEDEKSSGKIAFAAEQQSGQYAGVSDKDYTKFIGESNMTSEAFGLSLLMLIHVDTAICRSQLGKLAKDLAPTIEAENYLLLERIREALELPIKNSLREEKEEPVTDKSLKQQAEREELLAASTKIDDEEPVNTSNALDDLNAGGSDGPNHETEMEKEMEEQETTEDLPDYDPENPETWPNDELELEKSTIYEETNMLKSATLPQKTLYKKIIQILKSRTSV